MLINNVMLTNTTIFVPDFTLKNTRKPWSFRGLRPLGPHQGFALDPLGASRRHPDPLPQVQSHAPLT